MVLTLLAMGVGAQEEEGSGVIDEDIGSGDEIVEDIVTTTELIEEDIGDIIADIVEASGEDIEGSNEIGSGDEDEPLVVTKSASYSMASRDGKSTVTIIIQAITSSDRLNLVCDFSSSDEEMFSDQGCLPSIYLVAGHASCSSLPTEVNAKKLADIHESGAGNVLVDSTWSELPGKCMLIVRQAECGSDGDAGSGEGSEDDAVIIATTELTVEESDEITGSGDIDNSLEAGDNIDGLGDIDDDIIESMDLGKKGYLRSSRRYSTLRSAGFGRSFGTISLSGFTIISSGSTSAFTVSIPSIVSVPIYNGLTTTNYNKYSTLPLLQLSGWSYTDAVYAGIATILLYIAIFQLPILLQSIEPIKRRILTYSESDDFATRIDALQDGLIDVLGNTVGDFAAPWMGIVRQFGRNLLNRKYSNYYPANGYYEEQADYQYPQYPSYIDKRNGWYDDSNVQAYQSLAY